MKKTIRPVERHHVHIYADDWQFLLALYGPGSMKGVTVSEVIREIVHKGVKMMRQKIEHRQDQALSVAREGSEQ